MILFLNKVFVLYECWLHTTNNTLASYHNIFLSTSNRLLNIFLSLLFMYYQYIT